MNKNTEKKSGKHSEATVKINFNDDKLKVK